MRTEEITKSMATAYIDSTINSNLAYRPEFVSNDYRQGKKVLVSIDKELKNLIIGRYDFTDRKSVV